MVGVSGSSLSLAVFPGTWASSAESSSESELDEELVPSLSESETAMGVATGVLSARGPSRRAVDPMLVRAWLGVQGLWSRSSSSAICISTSLSLTSGEGLSSEALTAGGRSGNFGCPAGFLGGGRGADGGAGPLSRRSMGARSPPRLKRGVMSALIRDTVGVYARPLLHFQVSGGHLSGKSGLRYPSGMRSQEMGVYTNGHLCPDFIR